MKHLRNSLAHSGHGTLHFTPCEESKEITSIIFYDEKSNGECKFCVELDLKTIEDLIYELTGLFEMYKEIFPDKKAHDNYIRIIDERRELFNKN